MQYIQNEYLKVSVNPVGAELASIQHAKTGKEYIWEANPAIWGSSAPVLFPIIGALKEGRFIYQGNSYQLPKHGFIRYNDKLQLQQKTTDQLTFSLQSDTDSLQIFPFEFEFIIHFALSGNTLTLSHEVHNRGRQPMWFSLGGHPAFKCPINEGEVYEDYFLEFEKQEYLHTWNLNTDGLIAEKGRIVMDQTHILPLHRHLFDQDALILKNIQSRAVSLKSNKSTDAIKVSFEGFPYLGVWAKPQAPFVCIEPWQGIADHADASGRIEEKEGIMQLEAGDVHKAAYSIEVV